MIDLVGIGALNLDVIIGRTSASLIPRSIMLTIEAFFEPGAERPAGRSEIEKLLMLINSQEHSELGGSAFNVIRTIAVTLPGTKLGYVGSLGRSPFRLPTRNGTFEEWFRHHQINVQFVDHVADEIPGISISLMKDGDRQLVTYPGANTRITKLLSHNTADLARYLSRAKIVHVTSLFDHTTPELLRRILADVRSLNPAVYMSFDPGHFWVHRPTEAILELYKLVDVVFLNEKEFRGLGRYVTGEQDVGVASRILHSITRPTAELVVKRPHEIVVFSIAHGRTSEYRRSNPVIPANEIEDATGAGDIFAGGFLTGRLTQGFGTQACVELGLRLVRAKLTCAESSLVYRSFAEIFHDCIRRNTCDENDIIRGP